MPSAREGLFFTVNHFEFVETGMAAKLGFETAADLAEAYPYIKDALRYLQVNRSGKQTVANLFGPVFAAGRQERRLDPQPK